MQNLTPDCWLGILIGILISVFLNFLLERLWDWFQNFRHKKRNKTQLIQQVKGEIGYNDQGGVGDSDCYFELSAHQELLNSEFCNNALKEDLKNIITFARLCNGHAGRRSLQTNPGQVKGLEAALLKKLDSI